MLYTYYMGVLPSVDNSPFPMEYSANLVTCPESTMMAINNGVLELTHFKLTDSAGTNSIYRRYNLATNSVGMTGEIRFRVDSSLTGGWVFGVVMKLDIGGGQVKTYYFDVKYGAIRDITTNLHYVTNNVFHNYRMVVHPSQMDVYVDGVLLYSETNPITETDIPNVWFGERPGTIDDTSKAYVDYFIFDDQQVIYPPSPIVSDTYGVGVKRRGDLSINLTVDRKFR